MRISGFSSLEAELQKQKRSKIRELLINNNISIDQNPKIKGFNVKNAYKKYMKNKKMSDRKINSLFVSIINDLENSNDIVGMADKIYSKILDSDEFLSYNELLFFIQYTIYLSFINYKYDKDTKQVKLGYENFDLPKIYLKEKRNEKNDGLASCVDNQIEFYLNFTLALLGFDFRFQTFSFNTLLRAIQVINHEVVHYMQNYELNNGFYSESAYYIAKNRILRKECTRDDFDEYRENYNFKEVEIDAEIQSCEFSVELARKYAPTNVEEISNRISEKKEIILEQSVSHQFNIDKKFFLTDKYNVGALKTILRTKRNWCEEIPLLQLFFNMDGNLKSEKELLDGYSNFGKNYKEESISIYDEIFTYIYSTSDDYFDTDLDNFYITIKAQILFKLLKKECLFIKGLEELLNNEHDVKPIKVQREFIENNILNIFDTRKKRIKMYLKHLYAIKNKYPDAIGVELERMTSTFKQLLKFIDKKRQTMGNELKDISNDSTQSINIDERSIENEPKRK